MEETDMVEVPSSYEEGMIRENGGNRIANFNRTPLKPLESPFWDNEGALMMKGKRMKGLSQKSLDGRKSMIAKLRDTAAFQLKCYKENLEIGQERLAAIYLELAQESEARANKLQCDLNAKMAKARAARKLAVKVVEESVETK